MVKPSIIQNLQEIVKPLLCYFKEFEANDLPDNLEGLDNRLEQESDQLDEGHQEGTRMVA